MSNNKLVPIAIIVAGIIIAGAVFMNGKSGPGPVADNNNGPTDIVVEPVNEDDYILGNPNAKLALVEFSDLECPFCKTFHATAQSVIDSYGKDGQVAWVFRHFPLAQLHPKAPQEAVATECAGELGGNQAFWDYTNKIFEVTPSNNGLDLALLPTLAEEVGLDKAAFSECLESGRLQDNVQADFEDARRAGGTGTPYSVLISQEPLPDEMEDFIIDLIATTGLPPSAIQLGSDGKTISIGGALNFEIVKSLIDAALL